MLLKNQVPGAPPETIITDGTTSTTQKYTAADALTKSTGGCGLKMLPSVLRRGFDVSALAYAVVQQKASTYDLTGITPVSDKMINFDVRDANGKLMPLNNTKAEIDFKTGSPTGCAYFDEVTNSWSTKGLTVVGNICKSTHLTAFTITKAAASSGSGTSNSTAPPPAPPPATVIKTQVTFGNLATGQYTGVVKSTYEAGYGLEIKVWSNTTKTYIDGTIMVSTASARRGVSVVFTATVKAALAAVAKAAAAGMTSVTLAAALKAAAASLGVTISLPTATQLVITHLCTPTWTLGCGEEG